MPKFRIAETLRVEFIADNETASGAVEQYVKEFLVAFNSNNTKHNIKCMEGSDFTIHFVNENGSLGYEVDPAESDSQD